MPSITYTIRFIHLDSSDGIPCEEQEHLSLTEAWNTFRLSPSLTAPTCTPKSS